MEVKKPLTRRQARRKLGTRTGRRADTNGKNISGTNKGGKSRTMCYAHPRPVRRVSTKLEALLKKVGEVRT